MPESVMSATFGDLVKREYSRDYCREAVMLLPRPQGYPLGSVLGRVTASGKYTLCTVSAADGSEIPCAVLVQAVAPAEEDSEATVLVRGPVVLTAEALCFDESLNDSKTAVLGQLAAFGVVARFSGV